MRIGLNGLFLAEPATGSGQYTRNLLKNLLAIDEEDEFVLIGTEKALGEYESAGGGPPRLARHIGRTPFDHLIADLAKVWFEQLTFPLACRKLEVDLSHIPYFASPWWLTTKNVVTIHDLIPLILPEYRGALPVRLYTWLVAAAARRAHAVITDSQSSKNDIVQKLGIPSERIRVIYLAADEMFRPSREREELRRVLGRYQISPPYILYLGGFDRRKNLETLFQAFAALGDTLRARYQLVIAGRLPRRKDALFPDPQEMVRNLGLEEEANFIGWVPEEDKPLLYSEASLFVFPSLYEGFGLPVVEAMACGTPVIASNTSSLPELVGEGGLLFDPHDPRELKEAMVALLSDEQLARDLGARGLKRAGDFGWRRTAQETLALYREMAG